MSNPNKPEEQGGDLYSIAADWHNRMDDPDASAIDRAQLDVWLASDPRHDAAYRAIERIWASAGRMSSDQRILEFRHEALAAVSAASSSRQTEQGAAGSRLSTRTRPMLFTAAVVVLFAMGAAFILLSSLTEYGATEKQSFVGRKIDAGVFTTAVGERSTIGLSDGSSVVLNTNTRVDIRFSPKERHVRLLTGQAWFEVAKNPVRPFVVDAGDQRVTALGTAFDVRLGDRKKRVQVTLVEGSVTVQAIRSPLAWVIRPASPASILGPGDSLVVSEAKPTVFHQKDIAKVESWRRGQVVFDDDTLESAVEELNRYSIKQIVLADPAIAKLRVSGVFEAGHSQSFVETVTGHYPITVSEQGGDRIVLAPKQSVSLP